MRNVYAIAKREFASYFNSPVAYLVVTIFIVLSGVLFFSGLFLQGQADMRGFFGVTPLLLSVVVPFLTMRLLAEERAQGTLELLLTMPITDWQVVLGKYLASLGLLTVTILLTTPFAISVAELGPLDKGATLAAYVGMFLMAGTYAAIGVMASALTRSQIVAALVALVIGFGLFILGGLVQFVSSAWLANVADALSIATRFESIARGVIDSRDALYFVTLSAGCLLVAQAALESRRWR